VRPSTSAPRKREAKARRARPRAEPGSDAAEAGGPRYQQVARELKAGIASGRYPVGARLPTEAELCERYTVSRFTAREAVRLLATAGLVTRRQRAGTVVIAMPGEARYAPTLSSLNDLVQYARDTGMRTLSHSTSRGRGRSARRSVASGSTSSEFSARCLRARHGPAAGRVATGRCA
jgi:DNA-binding GntR family transcriptional regulator